MTQLEKMEKKDLLEKEKGGSETSHSSTDILGFLGFSIMTYIFFSSILISAQDILASTNIPTTSMIMCFNTPYFVLTFILPYIIDKMSLMIKAVVAAVFFGLGVLLITLIPTPGLRLIGVVFASIGFGTAEIGFLSATSLHQEMTIHSFTCGTALGSVIGTLYLSVMTTILCINPSTALQILLVILPIFPLLAWLINRQKNKSLEDIKATRGGRVEYTLLTDGDTTTTTPFVNHQPLTMKEKFAAARGNLYLAIPLYIGLFSDYLAMQGIITTIAFENSPFDPRDHYYYYQLVFWCSEIISRSYGLVVLWFKPTWTVVTDKTWIFSVIIACSMILLTLNSWYRFFSNFGSVAIVVAIIGATEGALYLNTFAVAGKTADKRPRHREFSRAILTVALQGGIVTAALMGFYVEPSLKEHCRATLANDRVCFTRSTSRQWNATSSCLIH